MSAIGDWSARHRGLTALIVLVVLAVGGWLFFYYFGFQNAVIDREVNEALPTAADPVSPVPEGGNPSDDAGSGAAEEPAPAPVTLSKGRFQNIEHHTSGSAAVIELPNGSTILRLEDLDTLNGPDLKVYLSESPAGADPSTFDDGFVSLGDLKGNRGDQNYDIPSSANLNKLQSAVIWCERFSVGFGVAPLERA